MSVDQVGQFATIYILCPRKVDLTICWPEASELLCCGVPRARIGFALRQFSLSKCPLGLEYCSLGSVPVMLLESAVILLDSTLSLADELPNIGRHLRFVRCCYLKLLPGEMSLYLLLQYDIEGIGLGLCAGSIKNMFPRVAGNPAAKGADGGVGHGSLIGGGRQ